jgi:hypothetical protein
MTKTSPKTTPKTIPETKRQKLENLLVREPFKGLKSILDKVSSEPSAIYEAVTTSNTYEELLTKLGYQITLTNQIHLQDCYSRVGPGGSIKAVLPYYDIPTQGSLPTLVNVDSTVMTTPKAADFFNKMLTALKSELNAKG